MKTRIILVGIAVIGLVGGVGADAAPLAHRVPGDALLYVGWAGRTLTFSGSMFGQLLDEPAFGEIIAAVERAAMDKLPEGPPRELLKNGWAMARMAWKHPAALVVLDIEKVGAQPIPSAAILIDLERDHAAFVKNLDALIAALPEEIAFTEATAGEVTYRTCKLGPDVEISLGSKGSVFFLAIGAETPKRLIQLTDAKALQANERFVNAMKAVSGDNVQAAFYMDATAVLEKVKAMMPPARPGDPQESEQFERISKALGADRIRTVAGTIRVVDRGMYTKIRLFTDPAEQHRGLLMFFSGKALTDEQLAAIPADALLAGAVNLSPKAAYDELKRIVSTVAPEGEEEFERAVAEIDEKLGVSVSDDLLANLGDTWIFASAPSLGGLITGSVLSVDVKDEAKFKLVLQKIEERFGPATQPASAPARRRGGGLAIETLRVNRTDIHYVRFGGRTMIPVAPAWAVHKNRLYVAAWPQVIQAAIANNGKDPLTKCPAFQKVRSKIAGKPSMMCYANIPAALRQVYPLLLVGWTMGSGALEGELGVPARPTWLPALTSLEKYLWPHISTVSSDPDGITFESYGSLPGGTLLASPAASPLSIAMLLPALHSARQNARRAASMANMNGIGKSMVLYQGQFDDEYPPDFAALFKMGGLSPKMLVSPVSGRKPPRLVDGKLVGEIDYIYLYNPTGPSAPGDAILAYERPENYDGKGTVVLFNAFNVRWMDADSFQAALKRTQEIIKKGQGGEGEDF